MPPHLQASPQSANKRLKLEYFWGDHGRAMLDRANEELSSCLPSPVVLSNPYAPSPEHVAIASCIKDGRIVGAVAASRISTNSEPFLFLEQIVLDACHSANSLLRRLVAMLLLRLAGTDVLPAALAARTPADRLAGAFQALAQHFTGSVCYPPQAGTPANLAAAQVAKRIAKVVAPAVRYDVASSSLRGGYVAGGRHTSLPEIYGISTSTATDLTLSYPLTTNDQLLLVIDLRSADETVLIDDARHAYRRP